MALDNEVATLKVKMENLEEAVDVLLDKELMLSIKRGLSDIEQGNVISLKEYEAVRG